MKCVNCESKNTRVTCTNHKSEFSIRYCRCLDCKHKFKTEERVVNYEEKTRRNTKLNENKVKEIRTAAKKAHHEGEKITLTTRYLAAKYDVDISTIKAVLAHRTWADVGVEVKHKSDGFIYTGAHGNV